MRWRRGAGGSQVEDRRGSPGVGGGGFGGLPGGFGRGGGFGRRGGVAGGGLGLIVLVLGVLFGGNVLGGGGGGGFDVPGLDPLGGSPSASAAPLDPAADPDADLAQFVGFVVDNVQDVWTQIFSRAEEPYDPTVLVLFEGATETGCGVGSEDTGPFYCPADSKVYLDLTFFRELRDRFGAPGDFAQAYVIAHEFGHHVQNVLGTSSAVRREQQASPDEANELSVRLELQADCLAGVWGHAAAQQEVDGQPLLEEGDLQEGLGAAAAVGDDRIQASTQGRVNPESFTHGSAEQRTAWFSRGFRSGQVADCDTFSGDV